jgi:hypothetical protein
MVGRQEDMSCYHTAREKFGHFTPDEKKAFEVTDSLSGGTLISALAEKYMDGHTQLLRACLETRVLEGLRGL